MDSPDRKRAKRAISGWLVLDKPPGMTSTQAVGRIRWLFEAKKAGHAGTLDPLATGILPIALGEATKTVPYVQDGRKTYRFSIRWGAATSTDDLEGGVIATSDVRPAVKDIETALGKFCGRISQVPPQFSAVHVDGERAYEVARAGKQVALSARDVEIFAFRQISHEADESHFEVECGKGTYVRALARDLSRALGTEGHVGVLRRLQTGLFDEASAIRLDVFEALDAAARDAALLPVAAGLSALTEIRVDARDAASIRRGNPVLLRGGQAPIDIGRCWASERGKAVAIGRVTAGQFHPGRVIAGGS